MQQVWNHQRTNKLWVTQELTNTGTLNATSLAVPGVFNHFGGSARVDHLWGNGMASISTRLTSVKAGR